MTNATQPAAINGTCNALCLPLNEVDYDRLIAGIYNYLYPQLWIHLAIASCTATAIMLVFSIGMACYARYMRRQLVEIRRLAVGEYFGPLERGVELLRLGPEINRDKVTLINAHRLPNYQTDRHMQQQLAGSAGCDASQAGQPKPPNPQPLASLPIVTAEHERSRNFVSVGEPFTPCQPLLGGGGHIADPARPLGKCQPSPAADRKQQEQPLQLPLRLSKGKNSTGSSGSSSSPARSLAASYRVSGDDSCQIVQDPWPKSSPPVERACNFGLQCADRTRTLTPRTSSVLGQRLSDSQPDRRDSATENYLVALAWPDGDDYDYSEAVLDIHRAMSRQREQQSGSSPKGTVQPRRFSQGKMSSGRAASFETASARGNSPAHSMTGSSVSSGVAISVDARHDGGARVGASGFNSSSQGSGDNRVAPRSRPNSSTPPERPPKHGLPFAGQMQAKPTKAPSVLRRQLSDSQLDRRDAATRSYVIALPSPEADDYDYSETLVDVQMALSRRRRSLSELRQGGTGDYVYCRSQRGVRLA